MPFTKIVITGASGGLGEGFALGYAAPGVTLGLWARRADELARVAALCREKGAAVVEAVVDVADRGAVDAAAKAFLADVGLPDLLVVNAGIGEWNPGFDLDETVGVFQVNLMGAVYTVGAFLPAMLEAGQGTVAALSSLASRAAMPLSVAYSASKAGLAVWMQGLRRRFRGRGVTFVTIHPGFIRTPMTDKNDTPMPFRLERDDGVRRMQKAIAKGRPVFAFPWTMSALTRLASWLPDGPVVALTSAKPKA